MHITILLHFHSLHPPNDHLRGYTNAQKKPDWKIILSFPFFRFSYKVFKQRPENYELETYDV